MYGLTMKQVDSLGIVFTALLVGVAPGQLSAVQPLSPCKGSLGAFPQSLADLGIAPSGGKVAKSLKDSKGLAGEKGAHHEDAKLSKDAVSAYVVSGSVVAFTANVGQQGRDDILKATLFAQVAANKQAIRKDI